MAEYPRVRGVRTQQGRDLSAWLNTAADRVGAPPRLLTALCIQESNLDEQSRRPTDPALDFSYWPDVSGALTHQAVAYAPLGDRTATRANIDYVLGWLVSHPQEALEIAADNIGPKWLRWQDGKEALSRYNAPGKTWAQNPNRANIARAWEASARYVTTQEDSMAGFEGGFAELAEQLGADVVGEPVEVEQHPDPDHAYQATSKGLFWYSNGGAPLFLPGVTA